jgi:hypothetical protein
MHVAVAQQGLLHIAKLIEVSLSSILKFTAPLARRFLPVSAVCCPTEHSEVEWQLAKMKRNGVERAESDESGQNIPSW